MNTEKPAMIYIWHIKRGEVSKEELFENHSCKGEVLGSWYSKYTYYSLLEPAPVLMLLRL